MIIHKKYRHINPNPMWHLYWQYLFPLWSFAIELHYQIRETYLMAFNSKVYRHWLLSHKATFANPFRKIPIKRIENIDFICLHISWSNSAFLFLSWMLSWQMVGFSNWCASCVLCHERACLLHSVCKPQGYRHHNDETLSKNIHTRSSFYSTWRHMQTIQID